MFLQVESVVGPRVASTLHHGLNAAVSWPGFSLPAAASGDFPICAFPWRPSQAQSQQGKNGLLGLAGRTQLGRSRILSYSKPRTDVQNVSQSHNSGRLEGRKGLVT